MNGISFEDGMKILNAARQAMQSQSTTPPAAHEPHKSVLSDDQAHAFQLMMLVTGQHGGSVGRGSNHIMDGLADAVNGGKEAVRDVAGVAGAVHSKLHNLIDPPHDVRPTPGTRPFKLDPNATPSHPAGRDDRQQEAARGTSREQWKGRMADHQGTPSADEPGWTN